MKIKVRPFKALSASEKTSNFNNKLIHWKKMTSYLSRDRITSFSVTKTCLITPVFFRHASNLTRSTLWNWTVWSWFELRWYYRWNHRNNFNIVCWIFSPSYFPEFNSYLIQSSNYKTSTPFFCQISSHFYQNLHMYIIFNSIAQTVFPPILHKY